MVKKANTNKMFGPPLEEPDTAPVLWSPQYEIGVDVIDQQHKRYYEIVNQYLEQAAEPVDDEDTLDRLVLSFEFLVNYANEHFAAEESIMKKTGYPGYIKHLVEHEYFKKHISRLLRSLETNGLSLAIAREVNFYAVEWYTKHILSVDAELAEFLNSSNIDIDLDQYKL